MRYPLVDGQGNFGSIDGDPPAAMRYTEARLTRIAGEMLADLDRETVDFVPNYDNTRTEPVVLPTRLPNLIVNGSSGIAVGMATNIPPHNIGETVDALMLLARNPRASLEELMEKMPGPDFPTGGDDLRLGAGIREAYRTGRGLLTVRARAELEEARGGRQRIVVDEIPYMVNKASMIEKIAELVRDGRIDGISDVRDESDRRGMRVVVELKKDADDQVVLNQLYKLTPMQTTFGVNMVALVRNRPQTLGLVALLHALPRLPPRGRAAPRGLRPAPGRGARAHPGRLRDRARRPRRRDRADPRQRQSPADAREGLMARFELSERQAQAILELRLQRLTAMERQKILDELAEVRARIEELQGAARERHEGHRPDRRGAGGDPRQKYADARRTELAPPVEDFTTEDLIAEEDMVVTITHRGYAKRLVPRNYRAQKRGGKGKVATATTDDDFVNKRVRRVDARLPALLHEQGPRALAEGVRAARAVARRARARRS